MALYDILRDESGDGLLSYTMVGILAAVIGTGFYQYASSSGNALMRDTVTDLTVHSARTFGNDIGATRPASFNDPKTHRPASAALRKRPWLARVFTTRASQPAAVVSSVPVAITQAVEKFHVQSH